MYDNINGKQASDLTGVDSDLIREAKKGSDTAFEQIISISAPRVFSLVRQIVHEPTIAEDIAQEVFIRVYQKLPSFSMNQPFEPWLYRVTLNLAIDYLRKESRRGYPVAIDLINEKPSQDPTPDIILENSEIRKRLIDLISRLPNKQRRALILRDLAEFSVAEISAILRCKGSTVRVHLARARMKMRELIKYNAPDLLE